MAESIPKSMTLLTIIDNFSNEIKEKKTYDEQILLASIIQKILLKKENINLKTTNYKKWLKIKSDRPRAPIGGITVLGKFYPGGQWIPKDVLEKLSFAEMEAIQEGESVGSVKPTIDQEEVNEEIEANDKEPNEEELDEKIISQQEFIKMSQAEVQDLINNLPVSIQKNLSNESNNFRLNKDYFSYYVAPYKNATEIKNEDVIQATTSKADIDLASEYDSIRNRNNARLLREFGENSEILEFKINPNLNKIRNQIEEDEQENIIDEEDETTFGTFDFDKELESRFRKFLFDKDSKYRDFFLENFEYSNRLGLMNRRMSFDWKDYLTPSNKFLDEEAKQKFIDDILIEEKHPKYPLNLYFSEQYEKLDNTIAGIPKLKIDYDGNISLTSAFGDDSTQKRKVRRNLKNLLKDFLNSDLMFGAYDLNSISPSIVLDKLDNSMIDRYMQKVNGQFYYGNERSKIEGTIPKFSEIKTDSYTLEEKEYDKIILRDRFKILASSWSLNRFKDNIENDENLEALRIKDSRLRKSIEDTLFNYQKGIEDYNNKFFTPFKIELEDIRNQKELLKEVAKVNETLMGMSRRGQGIYNKYKNKTNDLYKVYEGLSQRENYLKADLNLTLQTMNETYDDYLKLSDSYFKKIREIDKEYEEYNKPLLEQGMKQNSIFFYRDDVGEPPKPFSNEFGLLSNKAMRQIYDQELDYVAKRMPHLSPYFEHVRFRMTSRENVGGHFGLQKLTGKSKFKGNSQFEIALNPKYRGDKRRNTIRHEIGHAINHFQRYHAVGLSPNDINPKNLNKENIRKLPKTYDTGSGEGIESFDGHGKKWKEACISMGYPEQVYWSVHDGRREPDNIKTRYYNDTFEEEKSIEMLNVSDISKNIGKHEKTIQSLTRDDYNSITPKKQLQTIFRNNGFRRDVRKFGYEEANKRFTKAMNYILNLSQSYQTTTPGYVSNLEFSKYYKNTTPLLNNNELLDLLNKKTDDENIKVENKDYKLIWNQVPKVKENISWWDILGKNDNLQKFIDVYNEPTDTNSEKGTLRIYESNFLNLGDNSFDPKNAKMMEKALKKLKPGIKQSTFPIILFNERNRKNMNVDLEGDYHFILYSDGKNRINQRRVKPVMVLKAMIKYVKSFLLKGNPNRAPPGGLTIEGKFYPGGQFIPKEVLDKLSEEEKEGIAEGKDVGDVDVVSDKVNVDKIMNYIDDNGGFTLLDGNFYEGEKGGFAVALEGYEKVFDLNYIEKESIGKALEKLQSIAKEKGREIAIGGWIDNNQLYLDLSEVLFDKENALNKMKERKQLGIWDFENSQTIYQKGMKAKMSMKDYFEWKKQSADKDKYQDVTNIEVMINEFIEFLDKTKPNEAETKIELEAKANILRAPKGGVNVRGKFYPGGQFIPKDVVAELSEAEKEGIEEGRDVGDVDVINDETMDDEKQDEANVTTKFVNTFMDTYTNKFIEEALSLEEEYYEKGQGRYPRTRGRIDSNKATIRIIDDYGIEKALNDSAVFRDLLRFMSEELELGRVVGGSDESIKFKEDFKNLVLNADKNYVNSLSSPMRHFICSIAHLLGSSSNRPPPPLIFREPLKLSKDENIYHGTSSSAMKEILKSGSVGSKRGYAEKYGMDKQKEIDDLLREINSKIMYLNKEYGDKPAYNKITNIDSFDSFDEWLNSNKNYKKIFDGQVYLIQQLRDQLDFKWDSFAWTTTSKLSAQMYGRGIITEDNTNPRNKFTEQRINIAYDDRVTSKKYNGILPTTVVIGGDATNETDFLVDNDIYGKDASYQDEQAKQQYFSKAIDKKHIKGFMIRNVFKKTKGEFHDQRRMIYFDDEFKDRTNFISTEVAERILDLTENILQFPKISLGKRYNEQQEKLRKNWLFDCGLLVSQVIQGFREEVFEDINIFNEVYKNEEDFKKHLKLTSKRFLTNSLYSKWFGNE